MLYDEPRFLDCGEAALSVEFGDGVDPHVHTRVLALDEALRAVAPAGVSETTPSYRALLVHYEPLEISRAALVGRIGELLDCSFAQNHVAGRGSARWTIPCCYDPALAEDIAEAAALLQLDVDALARLHAGAAYRAYMYGFAPGWLYLGGLPAELAAPRRPAPRGPTPQGAVLIGGGLSLVANDPMPTGWRVIGRTPERLFSLTREPPFLVAPGDAIRFAPIDAATFHALDARAGTGETIARREVAP